MTDRGGSLSDELETCSPTSSDSYSGCCPSSTEGERKAGKCKWFNVAKGWGFITPDDGSQEVFVHQSVIQMNGFRSLGDNEQVEFECRESDKGLEATVVTGPEGSNCAGSHRRPMKKKVKKIRCYNCGDLAQHIASKCNLGPQPKRCHNCKSSDHLIADCPKRTTNKENTVNNKKDTDDPQHQDIYSTDDMNSENSSIDINLNMSASPNSVSNGSTGDFS